ncbi:MAG: HEAT repeat domain-containing protein [Acidobacteriota bacterium]
MRQVFCFLLVGVTLAAQVAVLGIPKIDAIEFYGLGQVSPSLARQALGLSAGALLPASKSDAEERLMDIDRVLSARLEAVCCDDGKMVLYVGIEERGAKRYETRPAPGGASMLADEVLAAYRGFEQAAHAAELAGKTEEDLSKGYPLMTFPAARAAQLRFPALVGANLDGLREVLRESNDEYHRAIAASLLPYAPNKSEIVEDLHEALTDSDAGVRGKAIRGLTALWHLAQADASSKVRVSPSWFLELLHSVAWTDRTQALWALELLTRDRDVVTISRLRENELDALVEMARWKSEKYGYNAFLLVGRVAGMRDLEIRDAWLRSGRETVIKTALQATR